MIKQYLQQLLHAQIAVHPSDTILFVRNADIIEVNWLSKKKLRHSKYRINVMKNPVQAGFFYHFFHLKFLQVTENLQDD